MVLLDQALRVGRIDQHLVHALPELGRIARVEVGANALVARLPGLAAVGRLEGADRRDAHPQVVWVGRIERDRVEDQAAVAGLPFRPAGMLAQARDVGPRLASVVAAEQAGRLDAGVDGLAVCARREVPDVRDLSAVVAVGQAGARLCPGFAVVVAAEDSRAIPVAAAAGVQRAVTGADDVVDGPVSQNGPRTRHCWRAASLSRMKAPFLVPTRISTCSLSPPL